MDLVGPWAPVTLTGLSSIGGATVRSLKFGGNSGGEAWFGLAEQSVTISDELVVGTSGTARLFVSALATLAAPGSTVIGGGGAGSVEIAMYDAICQFDSSRSAARRAALGA